MSPFYDQQILGLHDELVVDLFAGGGGASLGIEMALGRQVDVAINHDPIALALHEANHPQTRHIPSDVFEVDPRVVCQGQPVGLLWASPDCTDHSKAKGGKPIRNKKRRSLAWVVKRWAGQVRPRCIMLENVEEFKEWGPLIARRDKKTGRVRRQDGTVAPRGERTPEEDQELVRDPARKGETFRRFVWDLRELGYVVEWRELAACDFGAPTTRTRLFMVARCDGVAPGWPEPTHGKAKGLKPFRTAAECIDWSIPMLSIFATKTEAKAWARGWRKTGRKMGTPRRPLAKATMRRVARGVVRFVLEAAEPFIVPMQHSNRPTGLDEPLQTITTQGNKFNLVAPVISQLAHGEGKGRTKRWGVGASPAEEPLPTILAGGTSHAVVAPFLVPRYGERAGQAPRTLSAEEPSPVVVPTGNGASLVAGFLARHWGGMTGKDLREPHPTVMAKGAQDQVVAASLTKLRGTSSDADPAEPLHTVTASGTHHGIVAAHVQRDFGQSVGQEIDEPLATVTPGGGGKAALVASFISAYYGTEQQQTPGEPLRTISTVDRFGLVTVEIQGEAWVLFDIAMRMFQPRELFRAQGFPDTYRIQVRFYDEERGKTRRLTKTEQVRMVGNSVSPLPGAALVSANCADLVVRDEVWVA